MARQYNYKEKPVSENTFKVLEPVKGVPDSKLEEYYNASPAIKRAMIRGYSGKARKIRVQNVPGQESSGGSFPVLQTFYAGLLGPFTIRRGFDVVLPEEAVEALRSANDVTTIECDFESQNRSTGHIPLIERAIDPRFPFIDYGEVPWEDYEAFCAEQRKKPNLPVTR